MIEADARERGKEVCMASSVDVLILAYSLCIIFIQRLEEEERDAKCESELHEYHAQRKKRLHDLWRWGRVVSTQFDLRTFADLRLHKRIWAKKKAKLEKLKREIAKREKAKDTSNLGRPQCNSGSFEAKELGHEDVKKDILFEADSHRNNKRSRDRFKCEAWMICRPLYILFNEVSLSAFPVLTFKLKFAAPHVSYLKETHSSPVNMNQRLMLPLKAKEVWYKKRSLMYLISNRQIDSTVWFLFCDILFSSPFLRTASKNSAFASFYLSLASRYYLSACYRTLFSLVTLLLLLFYGKLIFDLCSLTRFAEFWFISSQVQHKWKQSERYEAVYSQWPRFTSTRRNVRRRVDVVCSGGGWCPWCIEWWWRQCRWFRSDCSTRKRRAWGNVQLEWLRDSWFYYVEAITDWYWRVSARNFERSYEPYAANIGSNTILCANNYHRLERQE